MGKTGRFHSDLWDERERESERYRALVEKVNSLCIGDPQKASKAMQEIITLINQAEIVFKLVWSDIESEIKTENSSVLDAVSHHVTEIMKREHERWVLPSSDSPEI